MRESIKKFIEKPKNIFIIDGFGALLTALLLFFVLRDFNSFIGLPKTTFEYLSFLALIFSIYSIVCFFAANNKCKLYLKIICISNIVYCILTFGIVIYYYQSISVLGIIYFLGEIAVISGIIFLEIKIIQTVWILSAENKAHQQNLS